MNHMILRLFRCIAVIAAVVLVAGCARFPAGSTSNTIKEMSFHLEFNGPINDNYYYYVPIDTTGSGQGPVPVFPGLTVGEGWVTGSATHYVQYHQRQYTVFRITHLQPFSSEPIGAPVRSIVPEIGSKSLQFTVDLNTIAAAGDSVDVNIITTDQPLAGARLLDGLGRNGNDFINIDIKTNRTITNSESLTPETAGDVLDQNTNIQPQNDQTNPLDITDWSITLDV